MFVDERVRTIVKEEFGGDEAKLTGLFVSENFKLTSPFKLFGLSSIFDGVVSVDLKPNDTGNTSDFEAELGVEIGAVSSLEVED